MRARRNGAAAAIGTGLGLLLAAAGAAAPAAADTVDDGEPGVLSLVVDPYPLDVTLDPGESVDWPMTVQLDAPTAGALTLRLDREGALAEDPAGITLGLRECSVAWDVPPAGAATCSGTASTLVAAGPLAALSTTQVRDLGGMAAVDSRFLLATLALPEDTPDALQGASARFGLEFSASGDTETLVEDLEDPDPGVPPAATPLAGLLSGSGVEAVIPLALAAGLAATGIALRARRRTGGRR